jgi:hypothetical protein
VGVSQTILKVGQLKIISAQISEPILIWFFISHTVHNRYKLAEKKSEKILEDILKYPLLCNCI